jgi:pimeloyl-ACP methyl ester carboxylesterase
MSKEGMGLLGLLWQYDAMPVVDVSGAKVEVDSLGSGRDLVLLHSLLAERSAFARVAPMLAKKRRVWLVSLPGYGVSSPASTDVEHRSACLALARVDLSGVLVGIGNRTLVMAGSEDATTPPALARELAAGIPGALPGDPRLRPLLADRRPGRLRERGRGIPLLALQPSM